MKKFIKSSLCIFIFITLFLSNLVLATEEVTGETEVITPETVLEKVGTPGVKFYYVIKEEDGTIVDNDYGIEIPKEALEQYVKYNKININGKNYKLQLSVVTKNENGEDIYIENLTSSDYISDADDRYIQYINLGYIAEESLEDATIRYSLVDEEGNVVASVDKNDGVSVTDEKVDTIKRQGIWDAVFSFDINKVATVITEMICSISIPAGDSFLHMISLSIGEPVSIDKVVYGDIEKLDINFFESGEATQVSESEKIPISTPLKSIMHDVINNWYGVFRKIALLVLMVILVYVGLKIILTSTAERKASYKAMFSAWVMGVALLMFFPYVMKYTIKLNTALCKWIGEASAEIYGTGTKLEDTSSTESIFEMSNKYGEDEFVMSMLGESGTVESFRKSAIPKNLFRNNAMMRIRFLAAKKLDLPLTVIYFILIGQLLAILVLYYKRVFMLAFLITVFPIVAMLYPLNKMGEIKLNCFGVWFKEFLVNVFVQSFHAVTYFTISMVGVNAYINGGNWIFMILSVLFLFEGEKIIRAIFNARSGMNSIGDMAASGAMIMSLTKNAGKFIPSFGGKDKSEDGDADKIAGDDRKKARENMPGKSSVGGAPENPGYIAAIGNGANMALGAGANPVAYANSVSDEVKLGRKGGEVPQNLDNLYGVIDSRASGGILGRTGSVLSKAAGVGASVAAQSAGGVLGFTYGMAQRDNKTGIEAAVAGAAGGLGIGKELGSGAKSIITGIADKAAHVYAHNVVADEIENSNIHDEALGLKEMDEAKAEAYRKIYADIARRRKGFGSRNQAEIVFIKEQLSQMEK